MAPSSVEIFNFWTKRAWRLKFSENNVRWENSSRSGPEQIFRTRTGPKQNLFDRRLSSHYKKRTWDLAHTKKKDLSPGAHQKKGPESPNPSLIIVWQDFVHFVVAIFSVLSKYFTYHTWTFYEAKKTGLKIYISEIRNVHVYIICAFLTFLHFRYLHI